MCEQLNGLSRRFISGNFANQFQTVLTNLSVDLYIFIGNKVGKLKRDLCAFGDISLG